MLRPQSFVSLPKLAPGWSKNRSLSTGADIDAAKKRLIGPLGSMSVCLVGMALLSLRYPGGYLLSKYLSHTESQHGYGCAADTVCEAISC